MSTLSVPELPVAPLAEHGLRELRSVALRVAAAGLRACAPEPATEAAVRLVDGGVSVQGVRYPLGAGARVVVLGAGKASLAIAAALERVLGDRLDGGAVVVRAGEARPLRRLEVLEADHPLPTERSAAAARRLLDHAGALRAGDLALACFTGGSSALAALPPAGVTIGEKSALHRALLGAGIPITAINAVRKHVSLVKGGRLAQAIAPATVVNLTVSDVAGDVLDAITDPTVTDETTREEAIRVLRAAGLWESLPPSVRRHLAGAAAETTPLDPEPQTVMLASGIGVCAAMSRAAGELGWPATVVSTTLQGEAREIGALLADLAAHSCRHGAPFAGPRVLVGCGGESTVRLPSGAAFGSGGPNQEAALGAALGLGPRDEVAAVFLDTDGSDGGTDVAGAVADGLSTARAAALGIDLRAQLSAHAARDLLLALGDAIVCGPTGTNVNDLFVVAFSGSGPRTNAGDGQAAPAAAPPRADP